VLHFLDFQVMGGHLRTAAAIDQRDGARPEAERRPGGVHGGVAAADHHHPAGDGVDLTVVGLFQEADPGQDPLRILTRNVHQGGPPGAHPQKNSFVSLVEQRFKLEVASQPLAGFQFDAQLENRFDLVIQNILGESIFRYAVAEPAAGLGLRLEHHHPMSFERQVVGGRHAGGSAAHDGDAPPRRFLARRGEGMVARAVQIGGVPLEVIHPHRLVGKVAATFAFAGPGADAPADGREGVGFLDQGHRFGISAHRHQGDVALDVDAGRAGQLTGTQAVGEVVRHDKLESRFARLAQLGGVGFDHHLVRDLGGATGHIPPGAGHLHHADETGRERRQPRVVAQRGDGDAQRLGDFQNGQRAVGQHFPAVDGHFNLGHETLLRLWIRNAGGAQSACTAAKLQRRRHSPQRMQAAWSITCTCFRSPLMQWTGQFFAHTVQPVHLSAMML